uniref:Uncharacterized protein n=1 Tax=Timema monikensis TaxID=170555 RepID=A0A7R9EH62_9NEOP|nr:unnamed protein product [Timema monikensis]
MLSQRSLHGAPVNNGTAYSKISRTINTRSNELSKFLMCTCCPYGYHIDLDFVRYCETFSQKRNDLSENKQRRRERRRVRQSMEVLLGLSIPAVIAVEQQTQHLSKSLIKTSLHSKPKARTVKTV